MTPHEIAELRKAMGLSQVEFGRLFGVHFMTVSKWERGKDLTPNAYQLALMHEFGRAVQATRAQVQEQVKNLLVGAGVVAALFFLLQAARK
jgi:DNA-binding transcriptional regulator YiaG